MPPTKHDGVVGGAGWIQFFDISHSLCLMAHMCDGTNVQSNLHISIKVTPLSVNFDMTVWILAKNDTNSAMQRVYLIYTYIHTYIHIHTHIYTYIYIHIRWQVISWEGGCVTPHTRITGTFSVRFKRLLMSKSTSYLSIKFTNPFWAYLIIVALPLLQSNTPIPKLESSEPRVRGPFTTSIVKAQFPSLRGTMWRNNGSGTRNGSRPEIENVML